MPLACPNCCSRYLRESQTRSFAEKFRKLWFVSPVRCRDCKTRFITHTMIPGDIFYARCPRCYRMDLNQWSGKTWKPNFWGAVKIAFGGHRWRCEYCRINFTSFRKRSEIFTFSRWKNMNSAQARADGRAKAAAANAPPGDSDDAGHPAA